MIECNLLATVAEEGVMTVAGRSLQKLLKGLPKSAPMSLSTITIPGEGQAPATTKIVLSAGNTEFLVPTLPAEDYPSPVVFEEKLRFEVRVRDLAPILRSVRKAISKDETRPITTGVEVSWANAGMVMFAATDTHRLHAAPCPIVNLDGTLAATSIIAPARVMNELFRLLPASYDDSVITFATDGDHVRITYGSVTITARTIAGVFPKWARVIPSMASCPGSITLNRKDLITALKRLHVIAQDGSEKIVVRVPEVSKRKEKEESLVPIRLIAFSGELGKAVHVIEGTRTGTFEAFALNINYLLDTLETLDAQTITLGLGQKTGMSPILVLPNDHTAPAFQIVIMPMQIAPEVGPAVDYD